MFQNIFFCLFVTNSYEFLRTDRPPSACYNGGYIGNAIHARNLKGASAIVLHCN